MADKYEGYAQQLFEAELDAYITEYGAKHDGEGTSEAERDAMRECFRIDRQSLLIRDWAEKQTRERLAEAYADLWRFVQYAKALIGQLRTNAELHKESSNIYSARLASMREARRRGAAAAHAHSRQHVAMIDIRKEFDCWQANPKQYANDAAFAKAMHVKHAGVIRNEGSIKNACTRWRRDQRSSC